MKLSKLIIFIFLYQIVLPGFAITPEVAQGDSAYFEGDYKKAINIYTEVAQEHGVSAALLFNMGNAYLQDGDYGNAMLCYQQAKKLDPSNKKINTNLQYLTGKVEDTNKAEQKGKRKKVTEDSLNFFQTIHKSVAQETSSNTWASWAAALFIIFSGCVALYQFNSNVLLRKVGFFGGLIFLGISMICLVCAYMGAAEADNHEYGVIVAYKAELQTEPIRNNNSGKNEGVLTRGTKIRIISEETDAEGTVNWYKIRLNSDYIGWVEAKEIEII